MSTTTLPPNVESRSSSPVFQAVNGSMQAAVFQDDQRLSIALSKRYRDAETNQWKSARTLFPGDLPNAIRALTRALEFCEAQ